MADDPVRGNGGARGFGIEFPASTKSAPMPNGGIRIVPDPLPQVHVLEIRNPGLEPQRMPVSGEWETLFLP
jgi:hypothetical protein